MEFRSFYGEREAPRVIGENGSRIIEGYAVVFEKESRMMFDFWKGETFVEIIKRGAVTNEDLAKWDIKALMEHDKSRLLARSFHGKGSLSLSVDDYGVKYRFEAPNTVDGDTALELIGRRDIFGSSFAFTADEKKDVKYTKRNDGSQLREVTKLSGMYDVSVVTDPAYFGTDVTARSLDGLVDIPQEEKEDESYKAVVAELRSLINN